MDFENEELFTKICYKCDEQVLDNLKIVYNYNSSKILLWNKFQIFIYKDSELEFPEKTFVPEFQINLIVASNNYLVCLDCNGNLHITSMKFKNSTSKSLKISFQPREQGVITSICYKEDHILSLKYVPVTYFLCLHRISPDFKMEKKMILLNNEESWPLGQNTQEKCLLISHSLDKDNLERLNKIFKSDDKTKTSKDLVVLSLDKFTIYGCLFSPMLVEDEIQVLKLYSCPAEITNMAVIDSEELYLLIGLTMGTIIRLSLNDITKIPEIVHLNTALYRMLSLKDSLIYSDGVTMWKAQNIFSNDTKFTQFFVRNTKDFIKHGDKIICTTFSKLIYKFSIEDENVYIIPKTADEYCSAEKLFNSSDCLNKLFEEIEKNNELIKKLNQEQNYITALALSKRQDVIEQAIETNVVVFECYDEIRNTNIMLTEEVKEYLEADTWLFLVTITNTNIYDTLNNILLNLMDRIIIYITLSTSLQILKTTVIKIDELLKTVHYLIPINMKNVETEINVSVKIVVNIPGALDKKKSLAVLYRKDIVLTSEHFIKTANKIAFKSLKKVKESIGELIQKVNTVQYGSMFKFDDVSNMKESESDCSFYVKLPTDYELIFKIDKYCKKHLNSLKSDLLVQQWDTEEFLKSKNQIIFTIGNGKVRIKIENDGFSNPLLKITGANAKTVFNIRNFFSNMIYNDYGSYEPGKEFIGYNFYTTTENLQKAIKDCMKSSETSEDILPLFDQFEKDIIGALPL